MSSNQEICAMSAYTITQLIRSKEISPVEISRAFLHRINERDPEVNAFCTVSEEQVLRDAQKAEEMLMKNDETPPLLGVPMAIKDLTPTKGIRTTYGSKIYADYVPDSDAIFITRVKKAGAIILGKTNTPEFGHTGITDNLLFGRTNNPLDTSKTPGGSSGGSAAAVAAGMAPIAEGSDGGGSIRIPASFCGLYGFKATFGRVPYDTGPTSFSTTAPFLHRGTLTRTVEDAALLLDVIKGPDRHDPFSLPHNKQEYFPINNDVKDIKIGYSPNLDYFEIDTEVKQAVENALKIYEDLGLTVEETTLGLEDGHETVTKTFAKMWSVQFATFYEKYLDKWKDQMSKSLVATIEYGRKLSAIQYKQLEIARSEAYQKVESVFDKYDLLITPTVAVPAFAHGPGPSEINGKPINKYNGWMLTVLFNLTGHPAASINCGYSKEGLPIGLQIIGPRFSDDLILKVSKKLEEQLSPNVKGL